MEKNRCGWCLSSDVYKKYHDYEWGKPVYDDDSIFEFLILETFQYKKYHDYEWGKPVYDDDSIFEFLILETFQAGLSWITVLNKRDHFRDAFDNFDYHKIANYTHSKEAELLENPGIIRNKLKVKATISNAIAFIKIQEEFSTFSNYIWDFVDGKPIVNHWKSLSEVPATTPVSDALSKDLKKRGFKFVGSTIIYAHMQATGMVNDHILDCWTRQ